MMSTNRIALTCLLTILASVVPASAQQSGNELLAETYGFKITRPDDTWNF